MAIVPIPTKPILPKAPLAADKGVQKYASDMNRQLQDMLATIARRANASTWLDVDEPQTAGSLVQFVGIANKVREAAGAVTLEDLNLSGGLTVDGLATLNGGLTVDGLLTLLDGQIKFPATQNPSSNANTLDDYEEGTWTPGISFGGAAVGAAYSTADGTYTKVGHLVTAAWRMILSNKGSSTGIASITGLPFTPTAGKTASASVGFVTQFAAVFSTTILALGTALNVYKNAASTASANMTNTDFTNVTQIYGSITYET